VAFYSGNDLFDSFNVVYNRGQVPALLGTNARVHQLVRDAENVEPLSLQVGRKFRMGADVHFDQDATNPPSPGGLRAALSVHSRIYGLVRRARLELQRTEAPATQPEKVWERAMTLARENPAYCEILISGEFRTILTPAYRHSAINLKDLRIAEGLRLSLEAIREMRELASAGNIKLAVVLIPTKEHVFRGRWKSASSSYLAMTEQEESLWRIVRNFLDQHGIDYVDTLPALREMLLNGTQPYPVTQDGHPNRNGHLAIAQALGPVVRQLNIP
jgi:hypothetical protein